MGKEKVFVVEHPFLIPPGEHISEWMENNGIGSAEFSSRMGVSPQSINKLLKGEQALTPEMAERLERVTGAPASFWNNLEADYRSELIRQKSFDRDAAEKLIDSFPIDDLKKLEVLPKDFKNRPIEDRRELLLKFFGVANEKAYQDSFNEKRFAARTIKGKDDSSMPALMAWIQLGIKESEKDIEVPVYDEKKFSEVIDQFASSTRSLESASQKKIESWLFDLQEKCKEAGVYLHYIHSLKGMRWVNGVTTWYRNHPVIQLSLYGGSMDKIIFSFLHEAGHVLKHGRTLTYVGCGVKNTQETEADNFAASKLLPSGYDLLIGKTRGRLSELKKLASNWGIYSGIVVGQFRHSFGYKNSTHLSSAICSFSWDKKGGILRKPSK